MRKSLSCFTSLNDVDYDPILLIVFKINHFLHKMFQQLLDFGCARNILTVFFLLRFFSSVINLLFPYSGSGRKGLYIFKFFYYVLLIQDSVLIYFLDFFSIIFLILKKHCVLLFQSHFLFVNYHLTKACDKNRYVITLNILFTG